LPPPQSAKTAKQAQPPKPQVIKPATLNPPKVKKTLCKNFQPLESQEDKR
jgi:hypothetical protein